MTSCFTLSPFIFFYFCWGRAYASKLPMIGHITLPPFWWWMVGILFLWGVFALLIILCHYGLPMTHNGHVHPLRPCPSLYCMTMLVKEVDVGRSPTMGTLSSPLFHKISDEGGVHRQLPKKGPLHHPIHLSFPPYFISFYCCWMIVGSSKNATHSCCNLYWLGLPSGWHMPSLPLSLLFFQFTKGLLVWLMSMIGNPSVPSCGVVCQWS